MSNHPLNQFKFFIDYANNNKNSPNLYFLIKTYAFKKLINLLSTNTGLVNEQQMASYEKMLNDFKMEKSQAKVDNMTREEYSNYLEWLFNSINFDSSDLNTLYMCRDLTEIILGFGQLDDLTNKRSKIYNFINFLVDYFNRKISILESQQNVKSSINLANQQVNQNMSSSVVQNIPQQSQNININSNPIVQPIKQQETIRVNQSENINTSNQNLSNQNSYNQNFNQNINPYNESGEYIPRFVDRTIRFPISKGSKEYEQLKEKIKTHIEYSGLELDFHKMDIAKDHIETAIYYLRNLEKNN